MRGLRTLCCAMALAASLAPGASADEYTKQTFLTFSGPVQLPGITLPAGTYMFKLADPESGRRTLQVWDKEGTKLFTTLLTIPNESLTAPDEPVVMFTERPAGQAQAAKVWFYPGDRFGQEFVYPKEQAVRIANANDEPVLAFLKDAGTDAAAMRAAGVERVTADRQSASASPSGSNIQAAATASSDAANPAPSSGTAPSASAAPAASPRPSASAANMPATSANGSAAGAVGTSGSSAPGTVTGTSGAASVNAVPGNRSQAAASGTRANQSDRGANAGTAGARRTLPQTASPIGAIALLSILALAGSVGVRRLRRTTIVGR
jgi:hypothetical protein